jgi:hypothetical protein
MAIDRNGRRDDRRRGVVAEFKSDETKRDARVEDIGWKLNGGDCA